MVARCGHSTGWSRRCRGAISDDFVAAPSERRGSRDNRTAEGGNGVGGGGVGSMVIITGLAAGQATAGAAASDGRSRNAGNGAAMAGLARRRLPGPIFHYIDGAADDEGTYRRKTEAYGRCDLVPNVLQNGAAAGARAGRSCRSIGEDHLRDTLGSLSEMPRGRARLAT